jgi:hypothetical protein
MGLVRHARKRVGMVFGLVRRIPFGICDGPDWPCNWLVPRLPWWRLALRCRGLPVGEPQRARPVGSRPHPRLSRGPEFIWNPLVKVWVGEPRKIYLVAYLTLNKSSQPGTSSAGSWVITHCCSGWSPRQRHHLSNPTPVPWPWLERSRWF